ncbi:MAG: hypothetical protein IIA14_11640 [SAR324 cluster bacterium]|nr:hypothetical protein [SAR324 cluster bacterium]
MEPIDKTEFISNSEETSRKEKLREAALSMKNGRNHSRKAIACGALHQRGGESVVDAIVATILAR